jgi:signal peptidase I
MDFSLIMFILLVGTGAIWALDHWLWAPKRHGGRQGKQPVVVEYARSFFPVILVVFLLRSFLVEPFRIPSGSMLPSLLIGDFILVNKFSYGIRIPIIHYKLVELDSPKRGEVVVFRFPNDPSVNYIKRVVGIPGDRVLYKGKRITINDQPMEQSDVRPYTPTDSGMSMATVRAAETLGQIRHDILLSDGPDVPMEFTVPPGQYFVMGDNRDHSNDSRYWGYVPDRNLVGRAFFIWFSWDHSDRHEWFWSRIVWNRIGNTIN